MHSRFASVTLSSIAAFWAAGCAVPIGPGYAIEKQQVRVQFVPAPEPRIRIDAEYTLKNTGNQPLSELELRLPGRRRFHFDERRATWDATTLTIGVSTENPRNAVIALPQPWTKSARHMLHLSVDYLPAPTSEGALSFSSNAFFLPAQGWSPELLPTRGLFATGGVPPKKWELSVRVPEGFLVHTSGRQTKASRKNGEMMVFASQGANDHYPFVIAGRYGSSQIDAGGEKINLWTKKTPEAAKLKELSEALLRATKVYDEVFGARTKERSATWIVECPVATGCFTLPTRTNAVLLGEKEGEPTLAEMVSADTQSWGRRRPFPGCELAGLRAESRILRAGASALRASGVRGVDCARGRGRNGLTGGNDPARAAIDPGEDRGTRAGRSSRGASKEFSFFLCIAGPLWEGSISKGDEPHVAGAPGARVGTKRLDCSFRPGSKPKCRGVRAIMDEAAGSAGRVSCALPGRRCGAGAI